jgi:hypothetical protein
MIDFRGVDRTEAVWQHERAGLRDRPISGDHRSVVVDDKIASDVSRHVRRAGTHRRFSCTRTARSGAQNSVSRRLNDAEASVGGAGQAAARPSARTSGNPCSSLIPPTPRRGSSSRETAARRVRFSLVPRHHIDAKGLSVVGVKELDNLCGVEVARCQLARCSAAARRTLISEDGRSPSPACPTACRQVQSVLRRQSVPHGGNHRRDIKLRHVLH